MLKLTQCSAQSGLRDAQLPRRRTNTATARDLTKGQKMAEFWQIVHPSPYNKKASPIEKLYLPAPPVNP
ncbi:protein of unknown function [Enterobacter cancerogenus]|nr:protein of unknown function [Enterobacter cancerogenus]